jgi:hypothetical protein
MTQITLGHRAASSLLDAAREAGLPQSVVATTTNMAQTVITWTPDLSGPQLVLLASLQRLALAATLITPAERDALENDLAGLRAYQDVATPTLAQTAAATKAQNRVLRALLRD